MEGTRIPAANILSPGFPGYVEGAWDFCPAQGDKELAGQYFDAAGYDPAKSVQENLDLLASYQTVDPCSGKPYIWNEDKQILYSIGIDRVDGGGTYDRETIRTDVVLPCVLYLRADVDQHKNK